MLGTKVIFFCLPEFVVLDVSWLLETLIAASINALNRGCPALGVEVNSGWNWHPINQGCSLSGISIISQSESSAEKPLAWSPAFSN